MAAIKVLVVLLSLLLAVSLPQAAFASSDSDGSKSHKAGIGPDSMFYAFDKLLDRIDLALAFGSGQKAGKALDIAEERLAEAKRMLELGKSDAARVAQEEYELAMGVVEAAAGRLQLSDNEASVLKEIEIESELSRHEIEIEAAERDFSGRPDALNILVPIRLRAAEARARVMHSDSVSVISIDDKENSELGSSTHDSDSSRDSSRGGRSDAVRIQARAFGDSARVRVEVKFSTASESHDAVVDELLSSVKLSKDDIGRLLDIEIENHPDELRERMRARARERDGVTRAELRLEFPLSTTDRQAIVDGIFEELNSLTADRIDGAMMFESSVRSQRGGSGRDGSGRDRDARHDDENEIRGRDSEAELRGRDSEVGEDIRGNLDEDEIRGRDSEDELRGRDSEDDEDEVRGRDNEDEIRGRESEDELRGREAEGEAPRGSDDGDNDDDGGSHNRRGRGSSGGGA